MSASPARRAALTALRRLRQREAFGAETLDAVLGGSGLSDRDVAFATRLTYGSAQMQGTLDEVIDRVCDRPERLEPPVRDVLRMAAYELLFMRTPARAVVHEGVDAVRSVSRGAAGLANAVLRRIADEAASFPWGDPDTDVAALARVTGHPLWFAERLVAELGPDRAGQVLRADTEPAPLYLWHVPFRGSFDDAMEALGADGAAPEQDLPPGCIVCGVPARAVRGRAMRDGLVIVSDAAAQIAPRVVEPRPDQLVVDLAAGRGGKTAQIQALAVAEGGACRMVAADIHPFKVEVLAARMADLGVPGVEAVVCDALAGTGPVEDATADAVLLDAPCSGSGTLRRRVDKRWRLTPEGIDELSRLQVAMLARACALVRVGGVVVYSTCSILEAENGAVVREVLGAGAGDGFEAEDVSQAVPPEWRGMVGEDGAFASLPAPGGPDGHFVARLRRTR